MKTAVEIPIVSLIYNRYKKASATQDAVVEVRVYYNRKVKYMSTRIRLYPKEWQHGRVTNRVDAIVLNKQLEKIIVDVRQVVYEMYEEGHLDLDAIPSRLMAKRKPTVTFITYCQERAQIRKYGKAADSQDRYDRFLKFLREYGKIKSFYDLSEAKVVELDRFLKKKNNMKAKSRWNNYHRFLNSFILDAQKEGLVQLNPYDRVKIDHGDDRDDIEKYLLPDEFNKLRTAKMPDQRLERIRDLFVFHAYTCMSYHDLCTFDQKKLKEVDGTKVYFGQRGKTKIEFTVPILAPAIDILKKYNGKLPIISNVKYNAYLKEVVYYSGIKKAVTTHWARHTGATLLLNAGVPIEVVSKVCGHSSIKMTERIYAKMLPKTVVAAVNEVEDKII